MLNAALPGRRSAWQCILNLLDKPLEPIELLDLSRGAENHVRNKQDKLRAEYEDCKL